MPGVHGSRTYVAEVFVPGHAKNYSQPFEITDDVTLVPEVSVKLDEGGQIAGRVQDGGRCAHRRGQGQHQALRFLRQSILRLLPYPLPDQPAHHQDRR